MRDAHGGVGRVDRLATGTAGPIDVDTQIVRVDDDLLVILDLRHDENACGARVNAALRLGDGHALHAVHPTLVLQVRPHALVGCGRALRADRERNVLETAELRVGRAHLGDAPAVRLRVAGVHARQIGGEQRGFFAALTRLDLKDDVHRILGVAGSQNLDERLVGSRFLFLEGGNLVGEGTIFGGQLSGGLEVSRGGGKPIGSGLHAAKLGVASADSAHQLRVRQRLRIRHLRLDMLVFLQQGAQGTEFIRRGHDSPLPSFHTVDKAAAPSAVRPTTPPLS